MKTEERVNEFKGDNIPSSPGDLLGLPIKGFLYFF